MAHSVDMIVCPLRETGEGNLRNSEGGVAELSDGRLLLAYTHFYAGANDFTAGDIRGKISEDGGKTWGRPFVIEPNAALSNVGRLSLLRLKETFDGYRKTGACLAHIYVESNRFYQWRLIFKTSVDEGGAWSAPRVINNTGMLGHLCQRGDTALVLSTGRILVPVYAMFGGMCASFMYYSDDGGDTWQRSRGEISIPLMEGPNVVGFTDFEEPAVAELRNGDLLCIGRAKLGQSYQSTSRDEGVTWSTPVATGLASTYAPTSLKTIPTTGDLLCVWHQASGREIAEGLRRARLSLAVSTDDAQTWSHFKNLESLGDRARIDPDLSSGDAGVQLADLPGQKALMPRDTQKSYPEEVTKRYPHWPGYTFVYYPSVTFTSDGNVVIIYSVNDTVGAGLTEGLKLVIRPIEWLYED